MVLFARRFPVPSDIALPHDISQLPYGGIQFDWYFEQSELDVTIESDGGISYALVQCLGVQTADHVDPSRIVELVVNNSSPKAPKAISRSGGTKSPRTSRSPARHRFFQFEQDGCLRPPCFFEAESLITVRRSIHQICNEVDRHALSSSTDEYRFENFRSDSTTLECWQDRQFFETLRFPPYRVIPIRRASLGHRHSDRCSGGQILPPAYCFTAPAVRASMN